ncbi:MAG: T9SS type A sorting domain-containing protein [Saprospiraceae bacterium]
MRKIRVLSIVILLITLSDCSIFAQQATLTSGRDVNGTTGSVSYSIGQPDYTNFKSDSGNISFGVQQPLVVIMVGTNETDQDISVSISPNPVINSLRLKIGDGSVPIGNYEYNLYDINGKLLLQKGIKNEVTNIPMTEFASGMYLLRVGQKSKDNIRSFKIFKTN